MKKGLIIAGLLSCTGSNRAVATPDSPPPLIVGGEFDDATNSNLGLLTRDTGINGVGATSVRIDLPLPELAGGGRDKFILGLECDTLQASICGGGDLRCYSCTAYGESLSGRPEDFVEYNKEVKKASRCTALIATKDTEISGIVKDPRGYKYQIKTLLPPESIRDKETPPGYGYEGIREQDWNVTIDYRVPEVPEEDIVIPIDPVGDHRALFAKGLTAPTIKSRVRRLPETDSSRNRMTQAKTKADDDGSTITLMYYLTKRAMCQWTGQSYDTCVNNPEALVPMAAVCTFYGNQALKNSKIEYQYENVHIHVDEEYDEGLTVNSKDRLDWIIASETAAALRDQYGADLVVDVFYMAGNSAGGIGYVPKVFPARHIGFSSQGGNFQLIDYIIAHEVGHNMGLNHNREEYSDGGDSDKSNYGYNDCNQCFKTIMSYEKNCKAKGCRTVEKIQYFSNVDVKYTLAGGSYAMGDAANDNSAWLEQSKFGVAMHRFRAPQLLLERATGSMYTNPSLTHLFFSVVAKESVEVNNIEFHIGGGQQGPMEVELYTATGPFEGKEFDGNFWGEAHVMEDVTPMSNANPLIKSGFSVFENFPTLSLSKGSTTSFKIKKTGDFYMSIAAVIDFFFENDHLQVMPGLMAFNGRLFGKPAVSLFGALRYTPTSDRTTSAPTISTSAPTISTPEPTPRVPTTSPISVPVPTISTPVPTPGVPTTSPISVPVPTISTPEPTYGVPTTSPISVQSCEDTLYAYNANWQNCKKMLKNKTDKQIDFTCNRWDKHGRHVKNHCPKSCLFDCAERCADDPNYVVVRTKGSKEVTYTCKEIPNQDITCLTMVDKHLVGEYCRKSCGMCG